MRFSQISLALLGAAALAVAPARAQLQFTLNPATQTYDQGTTATWSATFLNTGATTLTFGGIGISPGATGLTFDDTLFFTNFDATTLGAGVSVTANLFTTTADPAVPPATYNGNVTVTYTGGAPSPADASAVFTSIITVSIPEPGTLCLLGMGGLLGLGIRRGKGR